MTPKLRLASRIAVTASVIATLASASMIAAQPNDLLPQPTIQPEAVIAMPAPNPAIPTSQGDPALIITPQIAEPVEPEADRPAPTLAALVAEQPQLADLPRELHCLAGAIYFEAKSESLSGQLAVGRVVVARSKSGRFPNSYCGVVFQPSQFSFVRGGGMPAIPRASRQWRNAVAIAQIAHEGSWLSPVEGALFFHATHVSPGWRLRRIARVENHVFYR
jgi:N-acetylmuramoyl-L-alanine amidase